MKGQIDEAIRQYQEAIRLKPDDALAHNNLGIALVRRGQIDEAISQLGGHPPKPDSAEVTKPRHRPWQRAKDEAIRQFQEAIRLKPDYASYNLGVALFRKP